MATLHASAAGRVLALLGPTNTGKTHFAVERLLAHRTGVIGLPLRLLAREIYDRVVAEKGARAVALITGEEKILPAAPRWFVCTVESMPLDRQFEFLAVDEIQLCADAERGHVFTERLLRARGSAETIFLGAETMRGLIRRLVPEAEYVARSRFSSLTYAGPKKLSRLPRRSAVVAFSAQDVYAIAELMRRQRGGAAVVLGALSPRTRNAQVAMYQNHEVDFLVATDAIGMGLNMDVDHVAFAALRKFDGLAPRNLTAAETAQIAGRAGRHLKDGTFGTTAELGGLDAGLVQQVEEHRFEPVAHARWRNPDPIFDSPAQLLRSLEAPAPLDCLIRARDADDYLALRALSKDEEVMALARGRAAVRLLWRVCQVPDFRKSAPDLHARLLGQIFRHLRQPGGVLPSDWVARHIAALDRTDGDIDTLAHRIAHVRTWTFVSNRGDWLRDAQHWQERARAVEDKLSDALHERLTQRFVDRRTAMLVRRLKDRSAMTAVVAEDGEVLVEGQYVGRLRGLCFVPDATAAGQEGRMLRAAAARALGSELAARAAALERGPDAAISLADDGRLWWQGAPLARLVAGDEMLRPRLRLVGADQLDSGLREKAQARLEVWLSRHLADALGPLLRLLGPELSGAARGIAFQLGEGLGALARGAVSEQLHALQPTDRARLKQLGVRIGQASVYMPALLKPAPARLSGLLWAVHRGLPPPMPPPPGRVSLPAGPGLPPDYWQAVGFRVFDGVAIRLDMLERLAHAARKLEQADGFAVTPEMLSLAGCGRDQLAAMLRGLGYRMRQGGEGEPRFMRRPQAARRRAATRRHRRKSGWNADSPFARLKQLAGE